ncbi:MAG: hypothetical protein FJZ43_03735 [Candidatus Staskawiczbacteria bacterium]|nr:hypothetical protein [Candidatus Staskawiczbacteria bacterium]
MTKKGEIHWNYIIGAVLGGVVLFLIFSGAWKTIQPIVFAVELIGFNVSAPQGNGIIGLNLQTGNLEYYTGESFKKFTNQELTVLGGYEFNVLNTKNNINDFYFKTERRPTKLSLEINGWRYLEASLGNNKVSVVFKSKNGFIGADSSSNYNLDNLDNFNFLSATEGSLENYVYPFSQLEIKNDPLIKNKIVSWRDSILQGNSCEKFLTLSVKQNGVQKDLKYTVRKSDGYLVVDLTKPIDFGEDKWSNEKCFNFDNYVDVPIKFIENSFNIYLRDYFLENKEFYFNFDSTAGWTVFPDTKYVEKGWFSKTEKDRYALDIRSITSENPKYFLLGGMVKILQIAGDRGYIDSNVEFYAGSDITYIGGQMTFLNFYQKRNGFSKSEMDNLSQIIYDIITEYNKKLIAQGVSSNA